MGKTFPLIMGKSEVVYNIWSHALEFEWVRLPPFLMVRREVVCNMWSEALEFGLAGLPPF